MSFVEFFSSTSGWSVALVLLVVLFLIFRNHRNGSTTSVSDILWVGFGAASIPTGGLLIYCAIDVSKLALLTNVRSHIALVGLALIYVSVQTIKERL